MKRTHGLMAALAGTSLLVAAACSPGTNTASDDESSAPGSGEHGDSAATVALAGTTVTVAGPAGGNEGEANQAALNVFAEQHGMTITFTGARDYEEQINAQAAGGNPPDIGFMQPGKIIEFAEQGFIHPLSPETEEVARSYWDDNWLQFGTVDGTLYGVTTQASLQSLVWYNTSIFGDRGYSVPETWDELKSLSEQMIADGVTPWCVGIESGAATGWPFTSWVEDLVVRLEGPEFYEAWRNHDVPSDSPEIIAVWQEVLDLWNTPGAVYAAGGSIASTPFGDNGQPLVDGDCAMHKQANFFPAFLPVGTVTGPGGEVDVFFFPGTEPTDRPVLTSTAQTVAFRDAPEVWAVMEYLSSPEYARANQTALSELVGGGTSGFLSAAQGQDLSVYNELERTFIDILASADVVVYDFDASVPPSVEAAFWREGTSAINGDKSIEEALAAVEAAWP